MNFFDWLTKAFLPKKKTVNLKSSLVENWYSINTEIFYINCAISFIAGAVSKCEFKTFLNHKEVFGNEYYLWNYQPNTNQNSTQFIQSFMYKLLKNNEVLILEVNGQLIIADSFEKTDYAIYEDIFSNVQVGDFVFNKSFKMSEVIYLKLNENDITSYLTGVCSRYEELLGDISEAVKRGTGGKYTIKIDTLAAGDEKHETKVQNLLENQMKSFLTEKNAVLQLYDGWTLDNQSNSAEKNASVSDLTSLNNQIVEKVSTAFKMPPALLKGDIADIEAITDNFLTFCIDSLVALIEEGINCKRYGKEVLKGNYLKIDTTTIKHIDIFTIAEKIDKLFASSMYCVDELRRKVGDEPLNTPESKKHYITKNYQDITKTEGGENNE